MDFAVVLALSFLAGASTLLGGILSWRFRIGRGALHLALSGSTGALLSVVMLGVLPRALDLGGVGYTALGFILGGVVLMVTGTAFPHTYLDERYGDRLYSILKTASLIMTGIFLYNLPAGLLMGAGFAFSLLLGAAVTVALVLQNIPRGVAISSPLVQTGIEKGRVILLMLLSGLLTAAGAALSFFALSGSADVVLSSGLAFTSGAMIFVFVDQMMPVVKGGRRVHETAVALFLGLFIGVLILGIG